MERWRASPSVETHSEMRRTRVAPLAASGPHMVISTNGCGGVFLFCVCVFGIPYMWTNVQNHTSCMKFGDGERLVSEAAVPNTPEMDASYFCFDCST